MTDVKDGATVAPKKEVKAKSGTPTAKVEQTIGAGAKALQKAVEGAEKVLVAVKAAAQEAENITNDVATKKLELDALDTQFIEKTRQAVVDVELKVKEKKGEAIAEYLKGFNQEAVDSADFAALKASNQNLKTNFDAEVVKAKGAAEAVAKANYETQKKIDEANAKATAAQKDADLKAALDQVIFYKAQVQSMSEQIEADRDARVEEAKARGTSAVTVNNGK